MTFCSAYPLGVSLRSILWCVCPALSPIRRSLPSVSLGTQASESADFSSAVARDEHGQKLGGQGERGQAISSQLLCSLGTRFWGGSLPLRLQPLPDCPSSQAHTPLGSLIVSPFLVPSVLGVETSLCCCEGSGGFHIPC